MIWVLDYLDDLESDFSVFHRVDDIHSMPGPRFFRLARRIFAYDGVLRKQLIAELEQSESAPSSRTTAPGVRPKKVDLAAMSLSNPGLFERAEV